MKKRKMLCSVGLAALLLAGCTGPWQQTSIGGAEPPPEPPAVESTAFVYKGLKPLPDGYVGADGIRYYDQVAVDGGAALLVETNLGEGAQRILCDAEGCAHASEACMAWWGEGFGRLYCMDGYLLRYVEEQAEPWAASLYMLEPDGSGRTLFWQFEEFQYLSALVEGDGYVLVGSRTLEGTRQWHATIGECTEYLRIDLATGEGTALDLPAGRIKGAWNEQLLLEKGNSLLVYSMNTGEEHGIAMDCRFVEDGVVYGICGDSGGKFLAGYSLETQMLDVLLRAGKDETVVLSGIFDGVLFAQLMGPGEGSWRSYWVDSLTGAVYDAQTSGTVWAAYEGKYLISYDVVEYSHTAKNGEAIVNVRFQYALIDAGDFWAGSSQSLTPVPLVELPLKV